MPSTANTTRNTTVCRRWSSAYTFILGWLVLTAHCTRAERAALPLDHWNAQSTDVHVRRVADDGGGNGDGELEHEPGLRALTPVAASACGIADDSR
jgi:hypothetical protein